MHDTILVHVPDWRKIISISLLFFSAWKKLVTSTCLSKKFGLAESGMDRQPAEEVRMSWNLAMWRMLFLGIICKEIWGFQPQQ
jgi:hypothetical protein